MVFYKLMFSTHKRLGVDSKSLTMMLELNGVNLNHKPFQQRKELPITTYNFKIQMVS